MDDRLSVLKSTFGEIVDLKEGNINALKTLDSKIHQIKSMYSDFINSNREQLFVFSLDAFHFQSKLVDLEYEDMNRMFLSITNRMYCDYYKLFKIMVEYVKENIPDKKLMELIKVHDNFPVYKDLEPFKQYDFQFIQSLHEIILVILTYIHTFITNKEHDLKVYQNKNQSGLNIDSFVSTFSFNTVMMNQRALLFINYVEFFHKSHTKYLKRFTMKLNLMLSQLNNDIKLDAVPDTKSAKKDMINGLKEQNVDKNLLKELKVSIADDSSISETRSKSGSFPEENEGSPKGSQEGSQYTIQNTSSLDIIEQYQSETISDLTDDVEMKEAPRFSNIKQNMSYKTDLSVVPEDYTVSEIYPLVDISAIEEPIQDEPKRELIEPLDESLDETNNEIKEKDLPKTPPNSLETASLHSSDDGICEPSDETVNLLIKIENITI